MTTRSLLLLATFALVHSAIAAAPVVPIYFEDNHAGSFYWLAEHLDLDEECTLIHFDAHCDASAVFDSDAVRTQLRRVASRDERGELLARWRKSGAIQCFNWIEPLMPAPISDLIWVPSERVSRDQAMAYRRETVEHLDGQLEASPRRHGKFGDRCRVMGLADLRKAGVESRPLLVTIDLDYFAQIKPVDRADAFEKVWRFVVESRNLRAVTFAISRPYLASDEEADALMRLALAGALSLPTARVEFGPFQSVGNDRSLRARELREKEELVPVFDPVDASEELRGLILANRDRITVRDGVSSWCGLLKQWEQQAPSLHLRVMDHQPSTDLIWRISASESAEVELTASPWNPTMDRIEWYLLTPEYRRCNLTANSPDEIGFASGAPPRPRWRELRIPQNEVRLPVARLRPFFDPKTGCGALRLKAIARVDGHIRQTPVLELRRFRGSGFEAAITEQFGLPYLFGSGELQDGTNTGPETGWGADCANFLVYAFRRQGRLIPWSNPKQLRRYLEPAGEGIGVGEQRITEVEIANGLVVHFGSHVAAVMEDRPPTGLLDANDLVAHQLEGLPELIALGDLIESRGYRRFDLLRPPRSESQADLMIGGDVMLGRTVGEHIRAGVDPFAGLQKYLESGRLKVVNLECVVSDQGTPAARKQYSFRAPPEAIPVLASARISAVGLANNHAIDFGPDALLNSVRLLRGNGISVVGAAEKTGRRYEPEFFTTSDGVRIALMAVTDLEVDGSLPIATTVNLDQIANGIAAARSKAEFVLCLVHWGDENTDKIMEKQRSLARWLIDHGVDAIAGSHPHVVQAFDSYHGYPIAYSLGNLVFDGAPSLAEWNRGQILEVYLGRDALTNRSFRLVSIRLDAKGFPRLASEVDAEQDDVFVETETHRTQPVH